MSERAKIRIRGIYSTALTDIFLKRGSAIVSPSAVVSKRFGLAPVPEEEEVTIRDRADKQGVVVEGDREKVALVVEALRSALPEAIYRRAPETEIGIDQFRGRWVSLAELAKLGRVSCEVEFPATA
jgi:hypothetical protein